jgi:hypothetical protein
MIKGQGWGLKNARNLKETTYDICGIQTNVESTKFEAW